MPLRALLLAALLAPAGPASAAAAADPAPWRAAEWGMDRAALAEAVPGLTPARLDYGGLTGGYVLKRTTFAGLPFRAVFQFDAEGRLRQVLFEQRRREMRPGAPAALMARLRDVRGEEDRLCLSPGGAVSWAEAVWEAPAGALHVSLSDFGTPGVLTGKAADLLHPLPTPHRDFLRDLEFLTPEEYAGGPKPQSLPRRLLARWRDPAATQLESVRCPPATD